MPKKVHPRTLEFRAAIAKSGKTRDEMARHLHYEPHYFYMLYEGIRFPCRRLLAALQREADPNGAEPSPALRHLKRLEHSIEVALLTDAEKEALAAQIFDFGTFLIASFRSSASPKPERFVKPRQDMNTTTHAKIDAPKSSLRAQLEQSGLGFIAEAAPELLNVQPENRNKAAAQIFEAIKQALAHQLPETLTPPSLRPSAPLIPGARTAVRQQVKKHVQKEPVC